MNVPQQEVDLFKAEDDGSGGVQCKDDNKIPETDYDVVLRKTNNTATYGGEIGVGVFTFKDDTNPFLDPTVTTYRFCVRVSYKEDTNDPDPTIFSYLMFKYEVTIDISAEFNSNGVLVQDNLIQEALEEILDVKLEIMAYSCNENFERKPQAYREGQGMVYPFLSHLGSVFMKYSLQSLIGHLSLHSSLSPLSRLQYLC